MAGKRKTSRYILISIPGRRDDGKDTWWSMFDQKRHRAVLAVHGTHSEDIGVAIRRGVLLCTDPLVEKWVKLQVGEATSDKQSRSTQ